MCTTFQDSNIFNHGGFPGGLAVKNLFANTGDMGLVSGSKDPLEKEMATHSSILAWEIPQQRSLVGSKRVKHDLATKQQQHS